MDYSFNKDKFVCVNAPRGPQVIEVNEGTKLSTVHPVSQYDTKEQAEVAAKQIDPSWKPKDRLDDLPTRDT